MRTSRPSTGALCSWRGSRPPCASSTSPLSSLPYAAGACLPSTAVSGLTGVRSAPPRARCSVVVNCRGAASSVLLAEAAFDGVEAPEDLVDPGLRARRVLAGLDVPHEGGHDGSSRRAQLDPHAPEHLAGDAVLGGEQAQ